MTRLKFITAVIIASAALVVAISATSGFTASAGSQAKTLIAKHKVSIPAATVPRFSAGSQLKQAVKG